MKTKTHNLHAFVPKALYETAKRLAGTLPMSKVIAEALQLWIEKRRKR